MGEQDRQTTLRYWLALTLTALVLRIAVSLVLVRSTPEGSDAHSYADQARRMISGETVATVYYWPPGRSLALVPFFLAFGTSRSVVAANSVFLDVACVLAVAALAHQVLGRHSAARLSGWVAALYPPSILLSGFSYSMNAVMLAMLICAYGGLWASRTSTIHSVWRHAAWFLSGGLLGFAILTRPSSVSVFLLAAAAWIGLIVALVFKPGRTQLAAGASLATATCAAAAFLCGMVCCLAPVVKHQLDLGAGWCVSSNNEATIFYGNNPYTPHYKTWHIGSHAGEGPPGYQAYVAQFSGQPDERQALVREAWRYILARPDIFLLRTVNRIRSFWGFDYLVSANLRESHSAGAVAWPLCLVAEAGGYCLVMLLVIVGLFFTRASMKPGHAMLLVCLALAYQVPYALVYASGTYRFPVMGFLFPFAGLALDEMQRQGRQCWHTIKGMRWLWFSVGVFLLIQLEYAYFVFMYSGAAAG